MSVGESSRLSRRFGAARWQADRLLGFLPRILAPLRLWRGGLKAPITGLLVAILFLGFAPAAEGRTGGNLLVNGDFTSGDGGRAEGWRTEQWDTQSGTTDFLYRPPAGEEPGMVGIINHKPNDARWVQEVRVQEEAWYHLAARVRVKKISTGKMGASLSFSSGDTYTSSGDLRGTNPQWQRLELWTKTSKWQRRLKVALRLGGYGSTNRGEAWFSEAVLERVDKPPPGAPNVFEPPPRQAGRGPWSLWALILVLGLITAALWRYLGSGPPTGAGGGEKLALALFLLGLFGVKLLVAAHFTGYASDIGTYKTWAYDLAAKGPENFYRPGYFADYPPGYMYILWLVGSALREAGVGAADTMATIAIKLPALLTDLFAGWLIFALLRRRAGSLATWAVLLAYALNPALIFDSAVWGQTDSIFTLIVFLGAGLIIDGSVGLGWALMALAALTKPQALVFLPLLAIWPANWKAPEKLFLAAVAAMLVASSLIFPVGGSHPLAWIISLYSRGAGFYGETSVNAFNLMAIVGGMRQPDSGLWMGLSYQSWGAALFSAYFIFAFYLLWRRTDRKMMLYLCFLTSFAFFLLMTRMHERYLYPSFLFLAMLLPWHRRLWILFCGLTVTYLTNLWYVLDALQANRFLAVHEPVAMICAVANVLLFGLAVAEGWALARAPKDQELEESGGDIRELGGGPFRLRGIWPGGLGRPRSRRWVLESGRRFALRRLDVMLALSLTIAAGGIRFFNLGEPQELVFDEVYFVEQARDYLRGHEFMDPHPPLAKLAIAGSIWEFGNDSRGWRVVNAATGSLLVGVAYLLGRKLFGSIAGSLAAASAIMLDGLFIVESRTAVIDIYYVTFGAVAYLLLFSFLRSDRRRPLLLVGTGVFVGLALASKLFIPAFTWLLVVSTILAVSVVAPRSTERWRTGLASATLVTAAGGAVYLACYLPHYYLGWWHGVGDMVKYFQDVVGYEQAVSDATHPYSSKWWTWPLLLRPVWYYFKDAPGDASRIVGVWAGGNPLVWWGGITATVLTGVYALKRRQVAAAFIVAGFLLHWIPWIPIGRVLFQYHYLPSLLFTTLALGLVVGELWESGGGKQITATGSVMLLPLIPVLGFWLGIAGLFAFGLVAVGYTQGARVGLPVARAMVVLYAIVGVGLAIYFHPLWLGIPIARTGYSTRMWFQGAGLPNWI